MVLLFLFGEGRINSASGRIVVASPELARLMEESYFGGCEIVRKE